MCQIIKYSKPYFNKNIKRWIIQIVYSDGIKKTKQLSRIIMEHYLGRKLTNNEIVRYKDQNSYNCVIENLEVMERLQLNKICGESTRIKYDNYQKTTSELNVTFFKNINTIEKAYWLGFISADGYISPNKRKLSIMISLKDKEIINNFIKDLNIKNPKICYISKNRYSNDRIKIVVHNIHLCQDLINLGVINKKSLVLRIPKDTLIDPILQYSYLLGLFDGDGSLSNGCASICSGSKDFIQDIKDMFNIGYKIVKGKTVYQIKIPINILKKCNEIYPNSLVRKRII